MTQLLSAGLCSVEITPAELAARAGLPAPTTEQSDVVAAPLGPAVVVAGAGSGKTETMANRVVWLVANRLATPSQVLGLTFTRKAAAELTGRIRVRLRSALRRPDGRPDPQWADVLAEDCTVLTYDAYARRLVVEHGLREGVEPTVRLAQDAARWLVARDTVLAADEPLEDMGLAVSTVIGRLATLSAELAGHLRSPDEVERFGRDLAAEMRAVPAAARSAMYAVTKERLEATERRTLLLPLVARFEQAKADRELMDFGDILRVAHRIATRHPEVGAIERDRYAVVLLDEYQDTSSAQASFLHSLYAGHPVTAVGDPCQAIYGFRGASEDTLRAFRQDFGAGRPADRRVLSTSFRNDARILTVANAVSAPLRRAGVDVAVLRPREGAGEGTVTAGLCDDILAEATMVADRIEQLRAERPEATIGVLGRRRSDWVHLVEQLRVRGVPYEITGLAGLLDEPEIVDVVETLRVLVDPGAGAALLRLLTGPRWQLGPRDLRALSDWSSRLAAASMPGRRDGAAGLPDPDEDEIDLRSLVDAVDAIETVDPRLAASFSPTGLRRLRRVSSSLRRLRAAIGLPLGDLVAQVERELLLDVEVTVRDIRAGRSPRAQLDRFVDVATQFAANAGSESVLAFLAYLDAARDEESGLPMAQSDLEVAPPGGRVQILTMHAAKGLEWDVVFLPGLVQNAHRRLVKESGGWLRHLQKLPYPLRGDADQLPELDLAGCADQKQLKERIEHFDARCQEHGLSEQRRLFYVAVTRARSQLHLSGYRWDTAVRPLEPQPFLLEAVQTMSQVAGWAPVCWAEAPDDGAENPLDLLGVEASWPVPSLGEHRDAVLEGADLVRDALLPGQLTLDTAPTEADDTADGDAALAALWRRDTDLLLRERERRSRRGPVEVRLPQRLTASQLVALARDPDRLARQLRRPLPTGPARAARRGSRFHAWLEQRFAATTLLDLADLPGSGDEGIDLDDSAESLPDLIAAFERSPWARREPLDVEVPFDLEIAGVPVRGRIDAVYADGVGYDLIDWKTGRRPDADGLAAAALQLAVYRLAWAELAGVPVERVRGGFHYVATGETYRPDDPDPAATVAALLGAVDPRDDGHPGSAG